MEHSPEGGVKGCRKKAVGQQEVCLATRLNCPSQSRAREVRDGRDDTAFLGCKKRRGLDSLVGLSGRHVLVEGELADR